MLSRLWQFTKDFSGLMILCPLTVIAEVMLELRIPYLIAQMIDYGIMADNLDIIYPLCRQMFFISIAALCFGASSVRLTSITATRFSAALRNGLFAKLQGLSAASLDSLGRASIMMRITGDVNSLQTSFMMIIRVLFRAPALLIISLYWVIRLNAELSIWIAIAAPFLFLVLLLIAKAAMPRYYKMLKSGDELNALVREDIASVKTIKAYSHEKHEQERFGKANSLLRKASILAERAVIINGPLLSLIMYAVTVIVLLLGSQLVIAGDMLTGDLLSYITYITQILSAVMMVASVSVSVLMSAASAWRVCELLATPDEMLAADADAEHNHIPQAAELDFSNVSFRYKDSGSDALSNIDLHIRGGEILGIIGGTGSGKSTLLRLLPRIYEAAEGGVSIAGLPLESYTPEELRAAIGYVPQQSFLFRGSVRDNLAMGKSLSEQELWQVLHTACAEDFIKDKPEGLNAEIGQGGAGFSGGERARLCLARALLQKPSVLMLDDSLAALDTFTESRLCQALSEQRGSYTILLITQRISSLAICDRIAVMDKGRLCGLGTHEELMLSCPVYAEIYQSQNGGVVL